MGYFDRISTETEYLDALDRLAQTYEDDERTQLISIITEYEMNRPAMIPPAPTPAEFIRNAMTRLGITQANLAKHLGSRGRVSELLTGKRTPSINEIKVLRALLGISADRLIPSGDTTVATQAETFPRYPVAEMFKRGWLEAAPRAKEKIQELINALCERVAVPSMCFQGTAFRRNVDTHVKSDPAALHAWLLGARLTALGTLDMLEPYITIHDDKNFLKKVVQHSAKKQGPVQVVEFLRQHGIALLVVPHLKRTHLDGGVFCVNGHPVIVLTLRYDRLDAFWFTLLHELAHLVLGHVIPGNEDFIIDDLDAEKQEKREKDANMLARVSAIPDEVWEKNRQSLKRASVAAMYLVAEELGIHPSIVAGRIRYERRDYRVLSQHVGSKMVRVLFPKEFPVAAS